MVLLLLLVTPLVNAGYNSWPSPSTCTLPEPLEAVNSTRCLNGTWYGLYTTGNNGCYSLTFIVTGNNTMGLSLTQTVENGCSQTIVTNYGTVIIGPSNTLAYTYSCRSEWNGDYVILATDCKTYFIFGICEPGSCEPAYYIEFRSMTPSDCTMNKVKKDLTKLGLCLDNFKNLC